MALDSALRSARPDFPYGVLDLWYADEGYFIGTHTAVSMAIKQLEKYLAEIGLRINLSKCCLWQQEFSTQTGSSIVQSFVINA